MKSKATHVPASSSMIHAGEGISRQESFDTLKFFLALFVVFIHTGFTYPVGFCIMAIARIAVPLFFMITGYYIPVMTDEKYKRHFNKIICFTVASTAFYFLLAFVKLSLGVKSEDWFANLFEIKQLFKFFCFNSTDVFSYHLWYFYALVYVFIIIYIARRFKGMNILYKLLPFLFLGNYILSYQNIALIYRNFLFTGLPYVLLGCLCRTYEKSWLQKFRTSRFILLNLVLCCVGLAMEIFVYKQIGTNSVRDHYLFTLPMAVCIFLLVLKHPHWGAGGVIALIGKKYSAYIYILHLFIISCMKYVFIFLLDKELCLELEHSLLYINSYPFLVFGITLLIVFIVDNLLSIFRMKNRSLNKSKV